MTSCRAIAVIRLQDRLVLCQFQGADAVDTVAWSDAITRCAALADKSIDRLAYSLKPSQLTVYVVLAKGEDIGVVAFMAESVAQRVGYLCCDKVVETFSRMFPERSSSLTPALCAVFSPQLEDLSHQFNDASVVDDRVAKVKKAVEEVKVIALENVERVIERGENLTAMVEQTEQLQVDAQGFHSQTTALRRQLWWNNARTKMMAAGIVLGFVVIVYMTFCGGVTCSS